MNVPSKSAESFNPIRVLTAVAGLFIWMGATPVQAQMVTVNPVEASGPLTNPLMGFRPGLGNYSQYPYPTLIHEYIPWKTIENQESDSVQKIRDYCDARWAKLPANNVKVIPRVYIDWDSGSGNEAWPSDLTPGDWSSQRFKDRVVRLVGRLGEVWNNDPRVAWVQTGLIGYWGEQESPVGIGQDGWGQRLGDAFTAAFPNKKFIVRNMGSWPGYNVGVYWDSFGHPGQRPWAWTEIINFNKQGRYLTEVVEGEVAYNWGVGGEFKDLYGGVWNPTANNGSGAWESSPDITLGNAQHTDNMIDVIRELHGSALGWISSYSPNNATVRTQAARMQKEFGYRFHITEFSCDARTDPGANLNFQFKVKNKGSAPIYENWPLAVVLVDKTTRQLLWKATIPNVDIRKWHPGAEYNKTTRTYQTSAQEHLISASIPLPANLPVGEHLIGLSILEPLSRTPGLFFAVPNFIMQSQTQPLCKIGIGMNATGHTLEGIAFDDPVSDDTRSYTMSPQGPNYTLNLEPSVSGTISQMSPNGSYAKDTGVEVRAVGKIGYGFSSWGGALAGATINPAFVVMDANKSIRANYVPVATHRLNTTSSNGSIHLSPPGGIYNVGTEVTVTTTPSSGYTFSSWSGDLSGPASSTTLIMTGDKNVTANFIVPPITSPASFGVNCGGPSYTAGDGVLYAADGVWNSGGSIHSRSSIPIANTTDDLLHLSNRWGSSFSYNIPVTNGDYEVTLIFSEIVFNATGSRVFNVALEGSQMIANLDVFSRVGINAAHNESRIVTVNDGVINIAFSSVVNNANITAIKVTRAQRPNSFTLVSNATNGAVKFDPPVGVHDAGSVVTVTATPSSGYSFHSWSGDLTGSLNPATITINGNKSVTANFVAEPGGAFDFNINCGGAAYTAGDGSVFGADVGGSTYAITSPISGTTDGTLYQSERYGSSFSYSIPVTNGDYEVTLMFAEIYHTAANKRVFNVDIEGARVINSLDIWAKVGKEAAYNEQHVAVVNDGQLNITFSKVLDNAKVSAIKVKRAQPPVFHTLAANGTNGSVTLEPPGGVYQEGTAVTLAATSDSGRKFDSWSGDLTGNSNPAAITMNGNKTVTANFSRITQATIDTTGNTTVLDFDNPQPENTYIGDGFLNLQGAPGTDFWIGGGTNFAMTGGIITIKTGTELTNGGCGWAGNKADMQLNGTLDTWDHMEVRMDSLNGAGSIVYGTPWNDRMWVHVGLDNGSGTFSGTVQGLFEGRGVQMRKSGTGTQTFNNLAQQPFKNLTIYGGEVNLSTAIDVTLGYPISGAGNLRKSGAGLLTLAGSLNYTGSTTVEDGILSVVQPGFADYSNLTIGLAGASPAVLHLPNPGTDIVAQLTIDGTAQPGGGLVYDSLNSGGAITGNGKIQVGTAPTGYAAWLLSHGVIGGPNDDDDKDGRTNYEEYVFGQHPKNGTSVNPVSISLSMPDGTFSYTRRKLSLTTLSYSVWYSNILEPGSWMKDNGAVEGTPVLDGDVEIVPVTISSALLSNPKLFIQVRAE